MTQRATRGQVRQLITLCSKAGLKDRQDRLDAVSGWIGHSILSTTFLTTDEVEHALGEVKLLLEKDDGLPVPPPPPVF
jgi:hypothetical protein